MQQPQYRNRPVTERPKDILVEIQRARKHAQDPLRELRERCMIPFHHPGELSTQFCGVCIRALAKLPRDDVRVVYRSILPEVEPFFQIAGRALLKVL